MKKTNLHRMKWTEHRSPKGRFHIFYKDVAAEFAKAKSGPKPPGPAPFEVEMTRIPPGRANYPFHSHATEWEFYLIVSGTGTMRAGKKRVKLQPGDCVLNPPGEAHQILNTGREDLVYYCIANNAPTDVWHYPDSNKWGARAIGKMFRLQETTYYDGEE
jgi:uncharacterized cupin superfamily protein